jgi:hypothetical protein
MVNLWKVSWNDKQYFFPTLHGKFLVFLLLTEIKWITTHDVTPSTLSMKNMKVLGM